MKRSMLLLVLLLAIAAPAMFGANSQTYFPPSASNCSTVWPGSQPMEWTRNQTASPSIQYETRCLFLDGTMHFLLNAGALNLDGYGITVPSSCINYPSNFNGWFFKTTNPNAGYYQCILGTYVQVGGASGGGCTPPGVNGIYLADNGSGGCAGGTSFMALGGVGEPQTVLIQKGGSFQIQSGDSFNPSQNRAYFAGDPSPGVYFEDIETTYGYGMHIVDYNDDRVGGVNNHGLFIETFADKDNYITTGLEVNVQTGNTATGNVAAIVGHFAAHSPYGHYQTVAVEAEMSDNANTGPSAAGWF